jgi:hypothetical protein
MELKLNEHICLTCLKGYKELKLCSNVSLSMGKCQTCLESLIGAKAIKFKEKK